MITNALRLEQQIVELGWYIAKVGPLTSDAEGRVEAHPLLTVYKNLIDAQGRVLKALGPIQIERLDFREAHARAVIDLEAASREPAKGEGLADG